jgi:hypothetical protein
MKSMRICLVLVLAIALLQASSCFKKGENGDGDDSEKPNFIQDTCSGCPNQENIPASGSVTGMRFYSYVKNIGGSGKIGMSIGAGNGNASKEFDVTAGTRYVFHCTVSVEKSDTITFSYSAKFPGTPGYTDTRTIPGYHVTGGPSDLQLDPR